jgi:hypothetical protein
MASKSGLAYAAEILVDHFCFWQPAAQKVATLFANEHQAEVSRFIGRSVLFPYAGHAQFEDVGIESPAKSAIRTDDYEQWVLLFRWFAELQSLVGIATGKQVTQGYVEPVGVGAHLHNCLLGLAQFGSGDHFHGFGDLLSRDDRLDAIPNFLEVCCHI